MGLVRHLSLLVLAIAVGIGVVGKMKPHLFLQLSSSYGFIPWALTGNPLPPFFDERCLYREHWQNVVQSGDVVLSTGTKSGTLWMQTIVFLLRSKGWDGFDELRDYFGSCEFVDYPTHTLEQRLNQTAWKRAIAQAKGFQGGFQFFTHKYPADDDDSSTGGSSSLFDSSKLLFGVDPELNPDVKYIAVVRNGPEVVRSFYGFINSHTDEFKQMWGGFPPKLEHPQDALKFALEGNFYFGHVLAWWKRKHLPNVLLLHYDNLRQDPSSTIKQIATFLEIELTPQLLAQVVHKSSLQYMTHPKRTDKYTGFAGYPQARFRVTEQNTHIRPNGGQLDKGVGFFSEEMTQQWEAAIQKHLGHDPALLEFANTGVIISAKS